MAGSLVQLDRTAGSWRIRSLDDFRGRLLAAVLARTEENDSTPGTKRNALESKRNFPRGRVAQLAEHLLCKQGNSQGKPLPRLRLVESSARLAAPILLQDIIP